MKKEINLNMLLGLLDSEDGHMKVSILVAETEGWAFKWSVDGDSCEVTSPAGDVSVQKWVKHPAECLFQAKVPAYTVDCLSLVRLERSAGMDAPQSNEFLLWERSAHAVLSAVYGMVSIGRAAHMSGLMRCAVYLLTRQELESMKKLETACSDG